MEPLEQRSALLERPKGAMERRLRYWNAPKGPWNGACATGTPPRGHGTALALLERPEGAMEQRSALLERPKGAYALRQARFPALVSGLEGGIGLGLDGEAAGERSKSVVRTGI